VGGVLLVPALGSFCWFAVFGTAGLHLQMAGVADIAGQVSADISTGVFEMYRHYPMGRVMSVLMVVLISTFFITSANSATFVLSMYSSRGDLNPPRGRMGLWGILQAVLAFTLLRSGGLGALQTASIVAAAPFAAVMAVACWTLLRTLIAEAPDMEELRR
jgi:glycine betaine transporter